MDCFATLAMTGMSRVSRETSHTGVATGSYFAYFSSIMTGLRVLPIAPSSPFDIHNAERGLDLLRVRSFEILRKPEVRAFDPHYLNGSDKDRLAELQTALADSSCDLIWMARGGYGLTRILPSLKLPQSKMPVIVGFSDITALHCHLWTHKKHKGIHAPHLNKLADENSESLGVLFSIFEGRARDINYPTLLPLYSTNSEAVEGTLIVANLCVLATLIGTTSMPSLNGCILIIEEIGERPYRIDRMLTHLWHSGALKGVQAIIMGQYTSCEEAGGSVTPESVAIERCKHFDIPLFAGLPVGHDIPNWAIPFGTLARLKITNDGAELRILEELF